MPRGDLNLAWATALVEGLARAGMEHAVLSPGSRCTPLTLACTARLRTQMLVDERSAAFYALGLAKATDRPVGLVCTSGTAAANWYPAVVEASHGRVPLILLTADRPPDLQGCGANQTIDQVKLFGDMVRGYQGLPAAEPSSLPSLGALAARAVAQSLWPMPGPVHLNVPFHEPLVPEHPDLLPERTFLGPVAQSSRPVLLPDPALVSDLAAHLAGRPGVILCGELPPSVKFAEAVTALARTLECPILADPLSNLRRGSHDRDRILCHYDAWLHCPDLAQKVRPDWLIRFGAMPVSKRLQHYLAATRPPVQVILDAHGAWPDPQHSATLMMRADPTSLCDRLGAMAGRPAPRDWWQGFALLERHAVELLAMGDGLPWEWHLIHELLAALPANAILFIGNSMPVRDLDTCLGSAAKPLRIVANRGASGIDGNVSTLAGLAAGSTQVVVGLIGDLALFHDLNGLQALKGLDVILVVTNNGGGGIFHYLPQADLPNFERNWLTSLGLDFAHAARLFGLGHRRVSCRRAFATALADARAERGPQIIEAMIESDTSVARHHAYWAAVTNLPCRENKEE